MATNIELVRAQRRGTGHTGWHVRYAGRLLLGADGDPVTISKEDGYAAAYGVVSDDLRRIAIALAWPDQLRDVTPH